MKNKRLEQIAETDLQALVSESVRETEQLEYKKELNCNTDQEKKEFLADVSAFANASGGDLIAGIEDDKDGRPVAVCGLSLPSVNAEILKLENILRDGLEPRITVRIWPVPLSTGSHCLILRIQKSMYAPHMIAFKSSGKFFTRNSAGKHQMDVSELRRAFTASDIPNSIEQFISARLTKIETSAPIELKGKAKISLHLIPVSAFDAFASDYDLQPLSNNTNLMPMGASGYDSQYNMDGFLTHSFQYAYVQVFKNGIIEAVDASTLELSPNDPTIPSQLVETTLIRSFRQYRDVLVDLGVEPPVVVRCSIFNSENHKFATHGYAWVRTKKLQHQEKTLRLKEVTLVDFREQPADVLKPLIDSLWNAYGYAGSENYGSNGDYQPR